MNKQLHVISHTHWDIEWYFSAHESLIQLIYHLDEVMDALEKGEVDNYYLDGQLSIIEDYFHACPHQQQRFCNLVKSNKLLIGPWYTQTDQLIISGESIVRNLQLGIQLGRDFGGCEMLGYVPDSFGQSIDMPKIYNGVGITNTVFWRGLSRDVYPHREGRWQSEDGSEVFFYNIKDGYYVGGELIYSDDAAALVAKVEQDCLSQDIALPVGGDQRYIDRNIKQRIALYNQKLTQQCSDTRLIESSYKALFATLLSQDLPVATLHGEMIDGQVSKIHRSIYSSRADHKRYNDALERRISLELEPLMALGTRFGIQYQPELINNLWRAMTRNHAHDSAGGCNTDKTNKIITERFEQIDQMSSAARDYLVRKLAESQPLLPHGARLTLFNTLPCPRDHVQLVELSTTSDQFALTTLDGTPLLFEVLKQTLHNNASIVRLPKQQHPDHNYYQTTIALRHALPALGFTSLVVIEQAATQITDKPQQLAETSANQIENDRYQIAFQHGNIHITDNHLQQYWENALTLRDGGDDGDSYDYSPPADDWLLSLSFANATCHSQCGVLRQQLIITGEWALPYNLEARAQRVINSACKYTLRITLTRDNQPIDIELDIDNQTQDHRLQLLVNSPIQAQHSIADTPFGFVRRPLFQPQLANWRERGWKEQPCGIYPLINYATLQDEQLSLSVMAQGIKEYEVLIDGPQLPSGTLALTLFRSVGWLGKPDLMRRPGIASGQQFKYIPNPDSQMLSAHQIKLGLHIDQRFSAAAITQQWQAWSVNLPYYQQQSLNQFTNTLKYFVMHPLANEVAEQTSLIELDAPALICSSVQYRHNALYLRLFNPDERPVENAGRLFSTQPDIINSAADTNLLLAQPCSLIVTNQQVELGHFRAKQIRTIKIDLNDNTAPE